MNGFTNSIQLLAKSPSPPSLITLHLNLLLSSQRLELLLDRLEGLFTGWAGRFSEDELSDDGPFFADTEGVLNFAFDEVSVVLLKQGEISRSVVMM